MVKFIAGIALFSLPLFSFAELTVVSEVLIGQSQYKIGSSQRTEFSEDNYSSSFSSNSLGFRLGLKFTDNFSLELAKHDHGESVNNITTSIPKMIAPNVFLPPEFDTIYEAKRPIGLESIRIGFKGEMELLTRLFINTRFGLAHWKYKKYSPKHLIMFNPFYSHGESGNDLYYSLGTEYKFTDNFYVGIEYSLLKINESTIFNDKISSSYKHDVKDFSLVLGWKF